MKQEMAMERERQLTTFALAYWEENLCDTVYSGYTDIARGPNKVSDVAKIVISEVTS